MDIYLTNQSTGERIHVPLLPDRLNAKSGATVVSFSILKTGEVKIPRGSQLTGYSWSGVFPGVNSARSLQSVVVDWAEPRRLIDLLHSWEQQGSTIRLMITDISVNLDTFIESFTWEWFGVDDCAYTINLTQRRSLYVTTIIPPKPPEPEPTTTETPTTTTTTTPTGTGSKPTGGGGGGGKSYTVKSGDSLFSIALKELGDGTRWQEIYSANKSVIDAANAGKGVSQYTLQPGITLSLPKATESAKSSSIFTKVATTVTSAVSGALDAVKSIVTSKPTGALAKVASVASKVLSPATKVASAIGGALSNLFKK